MINYAREGDAVVVYSIDRLARDPQDIISTLNIKGYLSAS
ncbi:recombinase family protein [Planktotalea sp.]|nr:recombinase family protein [Planktotalea sp.]